MKLKNLITNVLLVAAPVVATSVGGPGAGALVATALGAGGLAKKAGQKIEESTGIAAHKVGAPVAAIAAPAAVAGFLPPEWMETVCYLVVRFCDNPGVFIGMIGILIHTFSSGAGKTVDRASAE